MSSIPHDGSENASSPRASSPANPVASSTFAPAGSAKGIDLVALAFAVALPILLVHLFVVKPTTTHLNQLRGQVARLESAMQELNAKTPTAGRSASLMASLTEQEQTLARAEEALDRMAELQHRLSVGLDQAERSVAKLDQLDQFRDHIDGQVALLNEANEITAEVTSRIGDVVANQDRVLTATDRLAEANASLDSLVKLESRLNSPLVAAEVANERLTDLIALKESLLDETENLPEAFDTLELMIGLNADIGRASEVFGPMQKLIANLVMLEPSIARVASIVEPMIEQGTISRMGGTELRLVLQELRRRHAEASEQLEAAAEPSDVATLPSKNETK